MTILVGEIGGLKFESQRKPWAERAGPTQHNYQD